jgi:aspartyl-tRNA(Asn)/glutamyl-tRNA(Gln) amidotransferase subunit A
MDIKTFINKLKNNEIELFDYYKKLYKDLEQIQKEYSPFSCLLSWKEIEEQLNNLKNSKLRNKSLFGVPISVKDAICVKDVSTRSSSKILDGYEPLFDATVIKKIKDKGGIIIGKTLQDEFGFGGFAVNTGVDFPIPKNPFDKTRVAGGSSGGCGVITKLLADKGYCHVSLGESTGGSIVSPANFCGVVGLCPTYGTVSRYGLLDYGNSLDKIGPIANNIEDTKILFDVIKGFDENDSTSIDIEKEKTKKNKTKKIALIKETFENINDEITNSIKDYLKKLDYKIEEISFPIINYALPVYYILATAEASTNLAKLSGLKYGKEESPVDNHFDEYFSKIRGENFGKEAKRRILLGTFARMSGFRDAYYIRSAKIRTKLIEEYKKLFEKYEFIVTPVSPILPPKIEEIEKLTPMQNYAMDLMTVSPNLAGLPHITFPINYSKEKFPIGILITANFFEEDELLEFGKN